MNNKFNFFLPIDLLEKGGEAKEIIIRGRASTPNADRQGDMIDVEGADLDDFLLLNDDHSEGTAGVIGEITKKWKQKDGIYIEGKLFPELTRVKHIVELAKSLKKTVGSKLKLGLSIEGKALQRDPFQKKRVIKSKFFSCAITLLPQNPQTWADILVKGISYQAKSDMTFDFKKANGGETQILEIERPDGTVICVDKDFNIKIKKAVTAGGESGEQLINKQTTGASLKKESVEDDMKLLTKNLLILKEAGIKIPKESIKAKL